MAFLDTIRLYIERLDEKKLHMYLGIILLAYASICGFIVYRFYRNVHYYKARISSINKKREELREILTRLERVKKEQADVDALLESDREFKIGGYFNEVMEKLNITQNKTREADTTSELLENGYTEVKLSASFANLSTQKLTELLLTIQDNPRIYTKELIVHQPNGARTINVTLVIATLEPKSELTGVIGRAHV